MGKSPISIRCSRRAVRPIFVATIHGSEFSGTAFGHFWKTLVTIGLSAVVAVGGLWLIGLAKCSLVGSQKESANYFPFESRSANGVGFVVHRARELEAILSKIGLGNTDVQFLVYLALLAFVHHQLARRLESTDYWLTSAPSMLVTFLWLVFMILAGLANWLDRWRIPTLLVFVLGFTFLLSIRGSTRLLNSVPDNSANTFASRVFGVRECESALLDQNEDIDKRRSLIASATDSLEKDAWRATSSRMRKVAKHENPKGNTLVVVTCPGGGIHAAAWAACVLDQLSTEYVEFKDSLCVISGVSGGSVGTLLFMGSRYENELSGQFGDAAPHPSTEDVHRALKKRSPALELAARSSLEAIAFGANVDDLYNLLGIPGVGRGQRLEDSLISRLPTTVQPLTMGQWGDRALEGQVPIVIFNSTDAISGRRILFDTIPTPRRASSVGLTARPLDYRELLDASGGPFDLLPATAARTSAAFPYISPFTKPNRASDIGEHVAICDGGFVDNEGIVSAVNWIDFFVKRWTSEKPKDRTFDRILLLRIEPSAVEDSNLPANSSVLARAFRWLTGPIETMANVRSASQLERGNLETDLAEFNSTFDFRPNQTTDVQEKAPTRMKTKVQPAPPQREVEIRDFDRRKLSPTKIRENWEQKLDSYQADRKEKDATRNALSPKVSSIDNTETPNGELDLIVQTITFVDANQSIPLNWKLINRQKLGYLLAWELCSSEGTPLRQTLDQFFNRARTANE